MTHLFIYRTRNHGDLESFVKELSAICDKKTRLHIHNEAASEDYSSLHVNLMGKDKRKMSMERFQMYLIPSWINFILVSLYIYIWQPLQTQKVEF